jgi:penicillin-binding protein 1A
MVRAIVGGYNLDAGGFNRATQALRQPGSAFKPLMYAAALGTNAITPASICTDAPVMIPDPWTGKVWKPENYEDGRYDGNITYRTALMRSKNTCSVRLIQKVTPAQVIETAHAMGISSKLPENLTLALGTGDVTPLELCNSYATIAAGGLYASPIFIRKVVDGAGTVLEEAKPGDPNQVLTPQVAYVLTSMMRSVVDHGTAQRALMLDRPLAGKTGTSQESRNVWFSGFSPELVATVWVGFDNNDPVGYETGSSGALPAWIRFMGAALASEPVHDFPMPENVVTAHVNPASGLPSDGPDSIPEVFVAGTEPAAMPQALPSIFIEDDDKGHLPH